MFQISQFLITIEESLCDAAKITLRFLENEGYFQIILSSFSFGSTSKTKTINGKFVFFSYPCYPFPWL